MMICTAILQTRAQVLATSVFNSWYRGAKGRYYTTNPRKEASWDRDWVSGRDRMAST
jgi:hypothetical protein